MVLYITYQQAKRLVRCMDESAPTPPNQNYRWFAFYGGTKYPAGTVYGLYSKDDNGLMGIIAREGIYEPESQQERAEVTV